MIGHGTLEQLRERVARVVDGRDPRAGWLRDLTVFEAYHESLAAAVDHALVAGPAMSDRDADDPDLHPARRHALVRTPARHPGGDPGGMARRPLPARQ